MSEMSETRERLLVDGAFFTRKWYFGQRLQASKRILQNQSVFARFASTSTELAHQITTRAIRFLVQNEESSFVNQTTVPTEITLPSWAYIFDPDVRYSALLKLAVINGMTLHEALHVAFTPKTLSESAAMSTRWLDEHDAAGYTKFRKLYRAYTNFVRSVINVLEDQYVEATHRLLDEHTNTFIDILRTYIGKDLVIPPSFNPSPGAPVDLNLIVTALVALVDPILGDQARGLFTDEVLALRDEIVARSAEDVKTYSPDKTFHDYHTDERMGKIGQLIVALLDLPEEEMPKQDADEPDAGGGDKFSGDPAEEKTGKTERASAEARTGHAGARRRIVARLAESMMSEKTSPKTSELLDQQTGHGRYADGRFSDVELKHVDKDKVPTFTLAWLPKWKDIGANALRKLLQVRTERTMPGQPRKRGPKLIDTRIHQIATNGHIFGANDTYRPVAVKFPEVILIADASGSICADLWNAEMNAMHGIFLALQSVGVSVTICAHSSESGGSSTETPTLWVIASSSNGKRVHDLDARFKAISALGRHQNYDGYILEKATELFRSPTSKKLIMLMSDGAPYGPGYGGVLAIEHTKAIVSELQERGICTMSVSLVGDVVEDNDEIYGELNIDASRGLDAVKKQIAKIVADNMSD